MEHVLPNGNKLKFDNFIGVVVDAREWKSVQGISAELSLQDEQGNVRIFHVDAPTAYKEHQVSITWGATEGQPASYLSITDLATGESRPLLSNDKLLSLLGGNAIKAGKRISTEGLLRESIAVSGAITQDQVPEKAQTLRLQMEREEEIAALPSPRRKMIAGVVAAMCGFPYMILFGGAVVSVFQRTH